jgi:hypothetical protein
MATYILFVFADFEDHEDLEFFYTEHFSDISEMGVKYIIESNVGNCILIFESDNTELELHKKLSEILSIDEIRFYFLFNRSNLVSARLPETLKDFIFKPIQKDDERLEIVPKIEPKFDLDEILDKIEKTGIDSLTKEEKKYLDSFGK